MFLKIKGAVHGAIKGESEDTDHKNEIDVFSWSWGIEAKPSLAAGGKTGTATVRELRVVKRIDSASTALMQAVRSNEKVNEAVLTLRTGRTHHEYLKITIYDGRVTAVTIDAGQPGGDAGLYEHVSFSFNQIQVVYAGQDKDGKPLGSMVYEDQFGKSS
jgi:type VI secretion system secreted protein Hcp